MNKKELLGSLKVVVFLIVIMIGVCICLAGCSKKYDEPQDLKSGGALYIGIEVPFHGFDMIQQGAMNPPQAPLLHLILEPLFRRDESGGLVPILGLSATPSADRKAWDIQLRRDVLFHDETPFNADAVIHHWTRILDPQFNFRGRRLLKPIRRIEKIDDYAVRFVLEHPWPAFINMISNDLALLAFIPSPKAVEAEIHHRKPVGTGPFKYREWRGGDHFIVLKNHRYWQKGKPQLEKVVFRTVPDPQTRFASLVAGQLDVVFLDRAHLIRKARSDPSLYTNQVKGNGAEIILMNTRKPPLDDIRVRRALALAHNQQLHVKMVYGNMLPLIHHPFGGQLTCSDDGYQDFDPARVAELIAAYGKPIEIECIHSNTSRGRQIGELQQQLYKKIGVTLKPVGLSPPAHMAKVLGGDYHLATWRIPPSGDHGPRLYNSFYSRSPVNVTGYSTPELDRLLDQQRIETDAAKRNKILCDIIRRLNRDAPFLYRGGRGFYIIARKKIRDMVDTPGFKVDLASAWIEDREKINAMAVQIEIDSTPIPFECPHPDDAAAPRADFIGSWEGTTSFGLRIRLTFDESDNITGYLVKEDRKFTRKSIICGPEVIWSASNGVQVSASVAENREGLKIKYIMGDVPVEDTFERIQ